MCFDNVTVFKELAGFSSVIWWVIRLACNLLIRSNRLLKGKSFSSFLSVLGLLFCKHLDGVLFLCVYFSSESIRRQRNAVTSQQVKVQLVQVVFDFLCWNWCLLVECVGVRYNERAAECLCLWIMWFALLKMCCTKSYEVRWKLVTGHLFSPVTPVMEEKVRFNSSPSDTHRYEGPRPVCCEWTVTQWSSQRWASLSLSVVMETDLTQQCDDMKHVVTLL